ncbi:hypothetical protein HYT23_01185 [Candidatus Pacearchaeota archaeon]|nr:hypothetical protein [Candidatus Pacearchaeota archaeon]
MKKVKKILFVCMHNRFRSKVAEAVFSRLNTNKKLKAGSAGFLLDQDRLFIAPKVIEEMNKRGYKIKGNPRQLTKELAEKFDILVVSADNVPKNFTDFSGKILRWNIKDCSSKDTECIKKRIDAIEKKVEVLIAELD